jgi:flagellar basal-body rod protein FlgB
LNLHLPGKSAPFAPRIPNFEAEPADLPGNGRWHACCFSVIQGTMRDSSDDEDQVLNNIFGIHEQALLLRGQRVGVLAANLANADTPNYKARDFDFDAALSGTDAAPLPLSATQSAHLSCVEDAGLGADLKYRNPYQASLDGNTVEMPLEQAAFAENSVRYQASLAFINQTIAGLQLAINGQ